MSNNNLPNATEYEWTDRNLGRIFSRGGRTYNLDTISSTTIERILKEDPTYWGQKFRLKEKPEKTGNKHKGDDTTAK